MNVVFDAICLADGPVTGVARSFLNGLDLYATDWASDITVLVPPGADRTDLPDVRLVDAPRGSLRRQRRLPALLRELSADVLHSSVAAVPLHAPCPTIATVHDLPWMHEESGERSSWWRRFATERSLHSATAVIAPSTFTLDAATAIVGSGDKLHLVPHTTKAPESFAAPSERTGPFLVLGDDRPRKNRDRVLQAHRLAKAHDPHVPDLQFVGPPGDYVTEAEKARLLRTCRAVIACSLYEGFGMPVLEALVHGAPLVCSEIPPHREIAGDLAIYVRPRSLESITEGMVRVLMAPPTRPIRPAKPSWRVIHEAVSGSRSS